MISDEAILAAIPADGIAFPALAAALGLTQRKLHPLLRRLAERGAVVVTVRAGIRWVEHDGEPRDHWRARALAADARADLATRALERARTELDSALHLLAGESR